MTRQRAYVALGEKDGGDGGGGGTTTPPGWPPGWPFPGPPWPPGYGGATYLGQTYKSATYSISITLDFAVTFIVQSYDGYTVYDPSTSLSATITGGGYRSIWIIVDEGESLGDVTSIDASSSNMTEFYFDSLPSITELDASGNALLTTIDLSPLVYLETVDLGQCGLTGSFSMTDYDYLTSLDIADNSLTGIDFSNSILLATTDYTGNDIVDFNFTNTPITSLDLSSYSSAETVDVTDCTDLVSLDVNGLASLSSVTLSGCSSLTTLDGSSSGISDWDSILISSLTSITLDSCSIASGDVDDILGVVEAWGTSDGTLDLCTNNAPGASGETDKATLEGRGWTVCTDVGAYLEVYPQLNAERGTGFNLIIQAFDADGNVDTSYVPSGNLTIAITSTDGSDAIDVTSTDNTGWSNGSKTVEETITGGSGDDTATITVSGDREGTTDTFNVKDSLAGSPSLWKVTFLDDARVNLPAAGVGSCTTVNCADIDYTYTGTYSNLTLSKNVIQEFPNTEENAVSPYPCDEACDASITLSTGGLSHEARFIISCRDRSAGGFDLVIGFDTPRNDISFSSWQSQLVTLEYSSGTKADCLTPSGPRIVLEAVS